MGKMPVVYFFDDLGTRSLSRECLDLSSKIARDIGWDTEVISSKESSIMIRGFRKNYKHMSTNAHDFEFACIERWFCLYDWMKATGTPVVFHCDIDTILHVNPDDFNQCDFYQRLQATEKGVAACMRAQWHKHDNCAGAHFSVWTFRGIANFVHYIENVYASAELPRKITEKYEWHQKTNAAGGICDMTLLYHFLDDVQNCEKQPYLNLMNPDDTFNSIPRCVFENHRGSTEGDLSTKQYIHDGDDKMIYDHCRKENLRLLGVHYLGRKSEMIEQHG